MAMTTSRMRGMSMHTDVCQRAVAVAAAAAAAAAAMGCAGWVAGSPPCRHSNAASHSAPDATFRNARGVEVASDRVVRSGLNPDDLQVVELLRALALPWSSAALTAVPAATTH